MQVSRLGNLAEFVASRVCQYLLSFLGTSVKVERRKSWLPAPLEVGGMGNKYDSGRCGTSAGTSGKESKMLWSKSVCVDPEMGEMERREPGVSGIIGGSIGDRSGMASSGRAPNKLAGKTTTINKISHQDHQGETSTLSPC